MCAQERVKRIPTLYLNSHSRIPHSEKVEPIQTLPKRATATQWNTVTLLHNKKEWNITICCNSDELWKKPGYALHDSAYMKHPE